MSVADQMRLRTARHLEAIAASAQRRQAQRLDDALVLLAVARDQITCVLRGPAAAQPLTPAQEKLTELLRQLDDLLL